MRPLLSVFLLALSVAGCAPIALPPANPSIEPEPINRRSSSPLEVPTEAPAAASAVASPAQQEAIKRVIERANNQQADAFAKNDPKLMRDTAADGYYDELVRINLNMASEGVAAIKLLRIEWDAITIGGDTAQATTFETWRTDYTAGAGDEARERNDYSLVRQGGAWKITSDVHPESQLEQPAAAPSPASSPQPAPSPSAAGRAARGTQSHNWSGYSATGGAYTAVSATWTVPRPAGVSAAADATWVGIGGVRGRDLIQAGTEQSVSSSGRVSYQAWIELLPKLSHPVQLAITPGDSVSVAIAEQPAGAWLVTIKDNTSGQSFQTSEQYKSSHSSAEWIEEAPSGRRGVLPLDNFGAINFSAASATKDGKPGSIAAAGGRAITMLDRGDQQIAQPSPLGTDGASFSVRRVNFSAAAASQPPGVTPARPRSPRASVPASAGSQGS